MHQIRPLANPFVMMTDPEAILLAVERSERLNLLRRHICRPLDRPLIPKVRSKDAEAYDHEVDLDDDDVPFELEAEAHLA
jgi:hypothetical protein